MSLNTNNGVISLDNKWQIIKYMSRITLLEMSRPKKLQESFFEKFQDYMTKGALGLIYLLDDKVVGERVGVPIKSIEETFLKSIPNHESYANDALYISSFSVHKDYQGQGIGLSLAKAFIPKAQSKGYKILIGHAAPGGSLIINKSLGATVLKEFPDWYGTGYTYYFYELRMQA